MSSTESVDGKSYDSRPTAMPPGELVAKDLCASYRQGELRVPVLSNASFRIHAGSFTAITGKSGSGKTTLLSLLGALEQPDSGSITVMGTELAGASRRQCSAYRRNHVGFVFQSFHLLSSLTALENVIAGLEPLRLRRREAGARAREALERVGLLDKAGRLPHQLSGGEQQRVAVARAVAKRPPILLADEPTGNLDEDSSEQVIACLLRDVRSQDSPPTLVLITHDASIAARAERILVVQRRQVHEATSEMNAS